MQLRPPDLTNLAGTDTGRGHLSVSSIGTQLACLRRYEYRYEQGLERIDRPPALSLGKAFHHAVEHRDPMAGANLLDERGYDDQSSYDQLLKDKAIVAIAAQAYLDRYPDDAGAQTEVEYRIRLRSPYTGAWSRTYDLVGRADGIIDHGAYLELLELKFVGRIDEVSVRRVKLDRQVGIVAYALWRMTGKPVRKIQYRFVKKPSIKQRQGESVGEYIARLEADYQERPDFYMHQETTYRDAGDLLEIEAELWAWAEMRREAKHHGFFPRNTSSCNDFGGCEFLDLCVGDPDAMSLYQPRQRDDQPTEATT